jgi:hypothetical protein
MFPWQFRDWARCRRTRPRLCKYGAYASHSSPPCQAAAADSIQHSEFISLKYLKGLSHETFQYVSVPVLSYQAQILCFLYFALFILQLTNLILHPAK